MLASLNENCNNGTICQPPVVELLMHLMQCILTAQQEKQEGARAWRDCLGT